VNHRGPVFEAVSAAARWNIAFAEANRFVCPAGDSSWGGGAAAGVSYIAFLACIAADRFGRPGGGFAWSATALWYLFRMDEKLPPPACAGAGVGDGGGFAQVVDWLW
jgi:hypothetical protein